MRNNAGLLSLLASGTLLLSGCGQAVLAHKLNALNARFENRLQMAKGSLPPLPVGQLYTAQLGATGGVAPYHWKIMDGEFPPGLTLDGSSGAISGVAARSVEQAIVVELTDSSGDPKNHVFGSIHFETVGGDGK